MDKTRRTDRQTDRQTERERERESENAEVSVITMTLSVKQDTEQTSKHQIVHVGSTAKSATVSYRIGLVDAAVQCTQRRHVTMVSGLVNGLHWWCRLRDG